MNSTGNINELRTSLELLKKAGKTIGLVPTMGSLHEGHLSLIRRALGENEKVIVSIYVNPLQFNNSNDLKEYPRDIKNDLQKLKDLRDILVYVPNDNDIYQKDEMKKKYNFGQFSKIMEGKMRPGHFDGVATVVEKLLRRFNPSNAYFGEKDFQQLQVITEMVETLDMPIEIVGGEIARDEQGLALSSRNAYLSEEELKIARTLNVILKDAAKTDDLEAAKRRLLENGFDKVDYIEKRWNRVLAAAWLGKTRLIDNIPA